MLWPAVELKASKHETLTVKKTYFEEDTHHDPKPTGIKPKDSWARSTFFLSNCRMDSDQRLESGRAEWEINGWKVVFTPKPAYSTLSTFIYIHSMGLLLVASKCCRENGNFGYVSRWHGVF